MDNVNLSRLRWSCRRGMLELDILLGNFLDKQYLKCSKKDQETFVRLLENTDQDLFLWLMGKEVPNDPEFRLLVEKIREVSASSHT
ncbi:hypothetical protein AYO45_00140 [Gammaproteobacteria bacterium SCGC AG-212-F23]|nr:hypothetical protein AYO45_00140 [Gammaproteobacteria bacterium SCGC AG-212-F23]